MAINTQSKKSTIFAENYCSMEKKALFGDKSLTFKFFLFVFLFIMGAVVGSAISTILLLTKGNTPENMRLMQGVSATLMFVVPPICHYLLTRTNPFATLGLRSTKPLFYLLAVALIVVSIPLVAKLTEWNEAMKLPASLENIEARMRQMEDLAKEETERMLGTDTWGGLVANLIVIALIAAVGEELTFRGVLQPWLIRVCRNPHVGIVVGAAVFSAIHFQFYGFVPRFMLGLLLGYTAYAAQSLWPSMLMHFINNGTATVVMFLSQKGVVDADVDSFGSANIYLTVLSALATIALVVLVWRKREVAR